MKKTKRKVVWRFFHCNTRPSSNASSSHIEGMGIELSGGKVWFESVEGKGTTFFVTLPLEGSKAVEGEKSLTYPHESNSSYGFQSRT
ncbi:MAG: hypothetical protein HY606_03680 [Planctomycetes bacterium]|nr:hypothetical protein [Planctomycetota bacterium]